MGYRNHEDFLATAEASIAAAATATNGSEFTSRTEPTDPEKVCITCIFTTAGGDGGEVLFSFQASFDGGTTYTSNAFKAIGIPSDEDNASNVVRHAELVDVSGISHLRLWKVTNGDAATAITSVNATISWGQTRTH